MARHHRRDELGGRAVADLAVGGVYPNLRDPSHPAEVVRDELRALIDEYRRAPEEHPAQMPERKTVKTAALQPVVLPPRRRGRVRTVR